MSTNLATLPRAELTSLVRRLAIERNAARRAATYWHERATKVTPLDVTPERTWKDAAAILGEIGADPQCITHRRDLMAALDEARQAQPANLVHPRRPGPRCGKGYKPCGKPLDDNGLCPRHDHKARRALREKAIA